MTLGQEFSAFTTLIREDIKILESVQKLVLEINLGATAIGTGVNAPHGYAAIAVKNFAKETQLPFVQSEDLVEATSDAGAYVMISAGLKRFAVKLSKICNDLRLLSSGPRAGLHEINLPEMQAGSSIMPAKINPVIPEVVNQVCFKVIGNDIAVTMAAEAGQLQLNVMEPVIAQCLFESMTLLKNACLTLREKCIQGITANPLQCYDDVMNSIGIVTLLDPLIGHEEGDIIGRICAETGKSVREVALERGVATAEELDRLFSFENLLQPHFDVSK
jgi:aspartate ammonia-lyase